MSKKVTLIVMLIFWKSTSLLAQFGFSHEIGAIAGPVAFQSDYGQRNNLETNLGNTGIGVGLIHYLNFSYRADCNCYTPETYFNDHFKVRTELSYNKTKLNHFGHWADKNSVDGEKLRAMQGSASVTNLGMQLEYYPFSIRDFASAPGSLAPFISVGAQYNFFKPEVSTSYGDGRLLNPNNIYAKYWDPSEGKPHGFTNDSGSTWSVVASVGTRYKLNLLSDLMVDMRWQYFNSNWVDGLNPNPAKYPENRANDWLFWLNFGYIYYLN
ncbi:THC0290_0291 family protein [Flavobacterium sp.]|uniref:THC0290_0291 family protein n=1 Tax=Flavobacterium sp. TaxID=239 RepID=UPI003D0EDC55